MEDQFAAEHSESMADTRGHDSQANKASHVSYINDLPVELLEEIFWHFVRDSKHHHSSYGGPLNRQNDNAYQIPPYRKPYGDPILLPTVCNRWRNIALTIPGLWSTIYLNTDHPHASHRLSLYLSRSGSEALTLSFMARKIRIPTTYALEQGARLSCLARYGELFANVLSLVPRCQRLYLDLHWQLQHSEAVAYLQHYNPANPSILEELSATFAGGWDARKVTNFFAYLQSSPALKNIMVKGLSGNINLTATQKLLQTLNTTSLHNVELDDFHRFDQLLPFLEKCDSLEQFSCSVANPPPPSMALVLYGSNTTPSSSSSTVLGRLHTLSLLSLSALDHLFKPLVLPSLRHLRIEHCWDMSSSDGSPSSMWGGTPSATCSSDRSAN
ncbi:hypothetical protein NMY22_g574 [Coprinellus aureogranulatus]|nr:hypothetical protein NMY22_g574 [Coprinellus aureogranulatus]